MGRQVASMARQESRRTSCQENMLEKLEKPCLPKTLAKPCLKRCNHKALSRQRKTLAGADWKGRHGLEGKE